jgi:ATP-dependent DNA helicase RecG
VKTSVKTSVKILELLEVNPTMTLAELAAQIGKTARTVELASSKLVKEGKLQYVGPQKGGHWEVLK